MDYVVLQNRDTLYPCNIILTQVPYMYHNFSHDHKEISMMESGRVSTAVTTFFIVFICKLHIMHYTLESGHISQS